MPRKKEQLASESQDTQEEEEEQDEQNERIEFSYSDQKEEKGFVAFFRRLEQDRSSDVVRFFERKGHSNYRKLSVQQTYYTVHGDNALFIAKDYYKTTSAITYLGGGDLPSQSVSSSLFATIVRDLLLNRRLRVEVYDTLPSSSRWKLAKKGSPGNVHDFEDIMFEQSDMQDTAITMAVHCSLSKDGHRVVGVCYLDMLARTLHVTEFLDDEHFSNLESVIVQIGAKECLTMNNEEESDDSAVDSHRLSVLLESCGVMETKVTKGDYSVKNLEQDLNNLLVVPPLKHNYTELEKQKAMASTACILRQFELLTDSENYHKFQMKSYDLKQYMRLDKSAFKALNIVPNPRNPNAMSLFGLLNHCRTAMGSRRLMQWIKQPLMDISEIVCRQHMVEIFVVDSELCQSLHDEHLKRIPDVNRLMRKILKGTSATLQDVLRLYQFVQKLRNVVAALEFYTGEHKQLVDERYMGPMKQSLVHFKNFEAMVEVMIDLTLIDNNEFKIKADYDTELLQMSRELNRQRKEMERERASVAEDLGLDLKDLHLQHSKALGHYFRVTLKNEKCLRKRAEFRRVDNTRKDGVKFRNATMHALNQNFHNTNNAYERRQAKIVEDVIKTAATFLEPVEQAANLVAEIDVFVSLAHVASTWKYSRPILTPPGEGDTMLKDSRHPCLEVQNEVEFIPNDVSLLRDKATTHIITGPNMGGKSTFIRQVALIAIMAQMGSFVPCADGSCISVVDAILCRVGAGDSQLRGVSTFMSEMLDSAAILRCATDKSLVVIDELGRGTSTYDGFGLAWAIAEHLSSTTKAFCLFATHFHELTALAETVPQVVNYHVTATTYGQDAEEGMDVEIPTSPSTNGGADNGKGLTFLYKIMPGPCDKSFGINVAVITNFPDEVVKLAKQKAKELESFEEDSKGHGEPSNFPVRSSITKEEQQANNLIAQFLEEFVEETRAEKRVLESRSPKKGRVLESDSRPRHLLT
ncbi:MutS-like protein [Balamuthia mandrillaris]